MTNISAERSPFKALKANGAELACQIDVVSMRSPDLLGQQKISLNCSAAPWCGLPAELPALQCARKSCDACHPCCGFGQRSSMGEGNQAFQRPHIHGLDKK